MIFNLHTENAITPRQSIFLFYHDIAVALENNIYEVLMFDLSAAFDVLDHGYLHKRLQYTFSITNNAFLSIVRVKEYNVYQLVPSFLTRYCQECPKAQLGPNIYCSMSRPHTKICFHHCLAVSRCADDTKVYAVVEPTKN